jgi:hypothetical protein
VKTLREPPAETGGIDDTVRQLRSLLAAETSAVTTYRRASRDVHDAVLGRRLTAIADRHAAQAAELRRQIARLCGDVPPPAPLPDAWSKLSDVTGSLGNGSPGWMSLRERERMGLKSYREALDRVDRFAREAFLGSLIPAQLRNVCAWNERSPES